MNSQIDRNSDPPRTNVILVVITNKANKTLGHDKYFKVFSPFGTIQRVLYTFNQMLIFERSLTWKTFVEYDNPDCAVKARMSMNDKYFCEDPTLPMNVYASKLTYITFQENNTGGVDYTVLRSKQKDQQQPQKQQSKLIQQQQIVAQTQLNYHFLQSQMQFQHQMSQQIQQINTLMGQLQQVSAQGFQSPLLQSCDLQTQIEKQQHILKDIYEQQLHFQNLTDTYSNFLQGLNKTDEQQSTSTQSNNTSKQNRKKLTLPTEQQNIKKNNDQIEFIQSYHESDITKDIIFRSQDQLIDQMQAQKMYQSEGKIEQQKLEDLNFDGFNLRDSDQEVEDNDDEENEDNDENQQKIEQKEYEPDQTESEENELFKYLDHQEMSEKDKQCIFQKLNQDIQIDTTEKIIQSVEKQTHQNTIEQSSKSVDNIDQLISNGRLIQVQRQQQSKSQTLNQQQDKIEEYVNPLFLKVRKSKVIYARWFDKKVVTTQMLYNIFSIYGNIDKMIYLKERSSVLIQYVTQDHAAIAKESLNDIMFYGQSIKIFFSNYEEISLKAQPIKPGEICSDPKTQEEYFQGFEETHRIKPDSTYTLAPPCDTIQISNLTKNSCQSAVMQQYLQEYGPIKTMKFVSNGSKYMCILKYSSMEVAITILANLNGAELDGKAIQINFSKQKL